MRKVSIIAVCFVFAKKEGSGCGKQAAETPTQNSVQGRRDFKILSDNVKPIRDRMGMRQM
jgi:hypothetical protein